MGLLVVVVLIAVAVLLHSEGSASRLARTVLARVALFGDARFDLKSLSIRSSGEIEIQSVRLLQAGGLPIVGLESGRLRLRWIDLLHRHVVVDTLRLVGPEFDVGALRVAIGEKPPETPTEKKTARRPLALDVGTLIVEHGRLAVPRELQGETAHFEVRDIELRGSGLRTTPTLEVRLDSLGAEIVPAGAPSPARLWVRGAIADRTVRLDTLRLDGAGTRLVARGRAPLASHFPGFFTDLELDVQADSLDAGLFNPFVLAPSGGGRVAAALHARVRGESIEAARGTLELSLLDAHWGARRIGPVHFRVQRTDANATFELAVQDKTWPLQIRGNARPSSASIPFDLVAAHPAGRLVLEGNITPQEGPGLEITRGHIEKLDLARLSGGLPRTDLQAGFTLRVRGTDPHQMDLEAALAMPKGSIGTMVLERIQLDAAMKSGTLRLETTVQSGGATVTVKGKGEPLAQPRRGDVQIDFAGIDLAKFLPQAPRTQLSGTAEIEASGTSPKERVVAARVRLRRSRCGQETLERTDLRIDLNGDEVRANGDIQLANGSVKLAADARPFDAERSYDLRSLRFEGLDLGALLDKPAMRTQLRGTASAQAHADSSQLLDWNAGLDLAASSIGPSHLEQARVRGKGRGESVEATAEVQLPGSNATVQANGTLDGQATTYRARASFAAEDLARALGRGPAAAVRFELDGEGTGLDREHRRATARLQAAGSLRELRLDSLEARIAMTGDRLRLDTLSVQSNVARLSGRGALALPDLLPPADDSLAVRGSVSDVRPMASVLGRKSIELRRGDFTAVLRNAGGAARLEAGLGLDSLFVDDASAASISVSAQGFLGPKLQIEHVVASVTADTLAAGQLTVQSIRADAELEAKNAIVHLRSTIDDSTAVHLAARGTLQSPGQGVVDTLDIRLGEDRWALEAPASVSYGRRVAVDALHLTSGSQSFRVAGVFDPGAAHDLKVDIDSLRLQSIAVRLGFPTWRGNLSAAAQLTGPATAPKLDAHAAGRIAAENQELRLSTTLSSDAGGVKLDAWVSSGEDSLVARGHLPIALPKPLGTSDSKSLASAPFTAEIRTAQFHIAPFAAFLPRAGITRLDGLLTADARIAGTVSQPRFEGRAQLEKGVFQHAASGANYENIALRLDLADDRLEIDTLAVATGKGRLQASGKLAFGAQSDRSIELHAKLDRFRAIWNRPLQVEATGNLDVTGTPGAPKVKGRLEVSETSIDVSNTGPTSQDVQLTDEDLRMLEKNFGYKVRQPKSSKPSYFDAAQLDVDLVVGHDTWIRRRSMPRLAIEMRGDLKLRKEPQKKLAVAGQIKTVAGRSYVEQLGRRFEIETGTVTFDGDPTKGRIDLTAKHELRTSRDNSDPDLVIRVAVKGEFDKPQLTLSSEPALEEADIVTALLTGRPPAGTTSTASGDEATSLGAAMVASQATGAVEDLGSDIGLDVLQVEVDGVRGATVIGGRYVNPKTYVGVRQSATFQETDNKENTSGSSTEVEFEYEFLEWLLFNLQGGVSDIRAMLRSRYEY